MEKRVIARIKHYAPFAIMTSFTHLRSSLTQPAAEVVLSGIPRKQGINAPAGFDKGIFRATA